MALLINVLFFILSFFIVLKAADYAIRFSTKLAKIFNLSDFVISFFIVAVISAFPETIISLISHLEGKSDVAFMALIGSNVVDLTFVFGVIAFVAGGFSVESKLMKKDAMYLVLLVLPLLLGVDGTINRVEGMVLVIAGFLFFYTLSIEKNMFKQPVNREHYGHITRLTVFLIVSLLVMIGAAHFTIDFMSNIAQDIGMPLFLIALVVIGTGVCLPEMLFSIQAIRRKHAGLALGDILGTVIIDATLVLGALAIIKPLVWT